MKLQNKVALITGASRGIGKAAALLFAKEGAAVVINYINSETAANAVVSEIEKNGGKALAVKCDVSKEDEVKAMIDKTISEYGKIDILVNNAGIVFDVPFQDQTVEQWKKVLDVNVIGTFLCSKYVTQHMKTGTIVNIASTNGVDNFSPYSMCYDSTKAAIILITKDLAKELGPNIRVNAVAPGWVDTDMNKDLPKDLIEQEIKNTYLKRLAEPDEIAKTILFLACDDSSYVTASVLTVDGGHM